MNQLIIFALGIVLGALVGYFVLRNTKNGVKAALDSQLAPAVDAHFAEVKTRLDAIEQKFKQGTVNITNSGSGT